ncbi:MAG: hypothetical protein Q8M66_08705, partial [Actinomycetota bacterium]|nr:hypothetical protein [Actinomycetota bacterium]
MNGTASHAPVIREDYDYVAGGNPEDPTGSNTVIKTGTWRITNNNLRSGKRFSYSNTAGSTLGVQFVGTRVEVVSDKDPYRGRVEILLDDVSVAVVDCYSPTTQLQSVIYTAENLAPGTHTIKIRALNEKGTSAARATFVVADAFKVYSDLPDSIAPECLSCHADKGEGHGGDFDHVATNVTGIYPGPDPDYSCSACHSLNMFTEHARTSSSSKAAGCGACHTTYAGYALNTYDGTCAWSECHQAANGHEPHVAASTLHIAADASTQQCRDCHGSDLALVHENAPNRCLTCHGPALYPTTTSCIDAVCHATSGVVSIETHPAPAHDASGTDAGVARTGGYACSTCHVLELVDEHAKPTSRGTGDTAISCASCHAASYFPAGWSGGAPSTNTCVACHDPAGAADAGVPHTAAGYGVAHDLRPYGSNASSCGTLAGAYCHGGASALLGDIAFADLLHDVSKPGTATCTSCHTTNTATPQVRTCSTCHVTGHDLAGSHSATPARFAANAECTGCHVAYGDLTAHTNGCAGCHGNATLTAGGTRYLTGTFTGLCTGCHTGTVLGTVYDPTDPNHYDDGKHTAQIAGLSTTIGTASGLCTDCHASGLKAEHAFTLSAGAVGCIDCHTNATLGSSTVISQDWPTQVCSACHGVQHNSLAGQHDLSASATALGCSGAGCHDGSDVASLHAAATVDGPPAKSGCNVCHASADASLSHVAGCDTAGCHDVDSHDPAAHNASG